jgi:hypothetical protein
MFGVLTQKLQRVTRTGRKFDILKAEDLRNALVAFNEMQIQMLRSLDKTFKLHNALLWQSFCAEGQIAEAPCTG